MYSNLAWFVLYDQVHIHGEWVKFTWLLAWLSVPQSVVTFLCLTPHSANIVVYVHVIHCIVNNSCNAHSCVRLFSTSKSNPSNCVHLLKWIKSILRKDMLNEQKSVVPHNSKKRHVTKIIEITSQNERIWPNMTRQKSRKQYRCPEI